MKVVSTRADPYAPPSSFREAVFRGLAADGGLYRPEKLPDLSGVIAGLGPEVPFSEVAGRLGQALLGDELGPEAVDRITRAAFRFEPILRPLEPGLTLLELFHGPTCAFKDFGAAFLAAAMEELLRAERRRILVLVATSGDTGSAVGRAFHRRANIDVAILYPRGRVSPLQEKQLTTLGENVTALEVAGSFDDCQRLVKAAFRDPALQGAISLTSANSINLGRLLPQAFYYIYGAARRAEPGKPLRFCVPSGNFGNLTAGIYAQRLGLPVEGFLAATNANDVVPEYLATGVFRPRPSVPTLSSAMDVGDPSNFERLLWLFDHDAAAMLAAIHPERVSDAETREAIQQTYRRFGVLVDPHTAVGLCAAERYRKQTGFAGELVVLATAHPGKFPEIVREATGAKVPLPPALAALADLPRQSVPLPNSSAALRRFVLDRIAGG